MSDTVTALSTFNFFFFFFKSISHETHRGKFTHHFLEVATDTEKSSDVPKATQLAKRQRGDLKPTGVTV